MGSTLRIYLFVLAMTVVVAILLAGLRELWKDRHDRNEAIFNKKAVLTAIESKLGDGVKATKMPDEEVVSIFENQITQVVVDAEGEVVSSERYLGQIS